MNAHLLQPWLRSRRLLRAVAGAALVAGLGIVDLGIVEPSAHGTLPGRDSIPEWAATAPGSTASRLTSIVPFRSEGPVEMVGLDGEVYFVGGRDTQREVYRLEDSAAGGAVKVTDLSSKALISAKPTSLTVAEDSLFFAVGEGPSAGLWATDGTSTGTRRLGSAVPTGPVAPRELTPFGGLWFNAGSDRGRELWAAGTSGSAMVDDMNPGSASSNPAELTVLRTGVADGGGDEFEGLVVFAATGSGEDAELWRNQGSSLSSARVKDIWPGEESSGPAGFEAVGEIAFFHAETPTGGRELWRTDGTSAGTFEVKDIFTGSGGSRPGALTDVGGTLYFSAENGTGDNELWKSSGTAAGTVRVADVAPGPVGSSPRNLVDVDGRLFFTAAQGGGRELWTSDGTRAGTHLVKDINPGTPGSNPANLTNVNGTLYFTAAEPSGGREVWMSDGTANGTVRVADITPGATGSLPGGLTAIEGALYFAANDTLNGRQVWTIPDVSAPVTTFVSGPADGADVAELPVSIGFESDEPRTTFECRVRTTGPDGTEHPFADFAACSGLGNSHRVEAVPEPVARVTVEVRATDAAGNVSASPAATSFTVRPADFRVAAVVNGAASTVEYGGIVSVPVTVTGDGVVPTGLVTMSSGTDVVASAELTDGAAVLATDSKQLGIGQHEFEVTYGGDDAVEPGTGVVAVEVAQASATISAPRTRVEFGSDAVVTVRVAADAVVPSGAVELGVDGAVIGSGTLVDGRAAVEIRAGSLPASLVPYQVSISYAGDEFVRPSDGTATLVVAKATSTVVTGSELAMTYGRGTYMSVAVTARGVVPSGRVVLSSDGTRLGSGALTGGATEVLIAGTRLEPGAHLVDVAYNGDLSVKPARSTATVQVSKASPRVIGSRTTVDYGLSTLIPVRVAATGVVPSGVVELRVDGIVIGNATLTNGLATVDVAAEILMPSPVPYRVSIHYSGDRYVADGAGTVDLVVRKAAATVHGTDTAMTFGQSAQMPVTVETSTGVLPTGRIVLTADGVRLGLAALIDGGASVALNSNQLPASSTPYEVTVRYTGDATVAAATTPARVTVNPQ